MRDGLTAGIDVGGTKILGVVLDAEGNVVAEERVPTPRGSDPLADALTTLVEHLRAAAPEVAGVGIGVPGLVDRNGTLRVAPNLPGVYDFAVHHELADRTGRPVAVDNDATCAAWGESNLGAGRGAALMVLVTLGTGIGGGLVADGALVRGANGFACEIGHMIVDPQGPHGPCGRRGCWERYASGSGLGWLGRAAAERGDLQAVLDLADGDPEEIRGEHVTAAALDGDPAALAVVDEMASWVALGLVNLVNALDPDVLVIGGGLVQAGDLVLAPTRRWFADGMVAARFRPEVPIVAAALGERAGAIGAALLARPT